MHIVIIGTVASSMLGFRADFIKKLVGENHKVYAFANDYTDLSKSEVYKIGAKPIDYSISRFGINPFADVLDTIKLAKKIHTLKPDVVFCYFSKPVVFGTIAAFLAGAKRRIGMLEGLGYTFTNLPEPDGLKKRIIKHIQVALYKISLPLLNKVIFLNPDDKHDLVDSYSIKVNKVEILGGIGVELNQYPYVPVKQTENINFTFVGRLIKEKGVDYFINAAALVKEKYPNASFTVLGDIEPESNSSISLRKLEKLNRDGVIQYHGQVSNISDWLVKCSVFVLPSYREGVPRSTQEAMATGRAIITTDVPGCRETVEHMRNGLLIPPHSLEALVESMLFFIERPENISVMGEESHKLALEQYDINKVNKRLYRYIMDD